MLTRHCEKCKTLNTKTPLFLLRPEFEKRWDPVRSLQIATDKLAGFSVGRSLENPHDDGSPARTGVQEFCLSCLDGAIANLLAKLND